MPEVVITALDQEGRGIARVDGKAMFVEGALIGERAHVGIVRRKPTYDIARLESLATRSASRVVPRCRYFGVCGGCSLQHIEHAAQVAIKQRVLEDALWHVGRVRAEELLPAIYGTPWEYRHRARFSVRDVVKKGGVLVGFHEKRSTYVADMTSCEVVPRRVSALLPKLRALVARLSVRGRVPQIELAIGDSGGNTSDALAFRVLDPLNASDRDALREFAREHSLRVYLQPGGPSSVVPLDDEERALSFSLPEFAVTLRFEPTDFTQVNGAMNRMLVRRAIALLAPSPGERIGDFFCGIGNFTLPIARRGARVVGVEGSPALVERAKRNAAANDLAHRVELRIGDLFEIGGEAFAALGALDKVLIDPPRDGAIALVKALPAAGESRVARIVYVSCNPATLARDAGFLVHERGWRLVKAGIANMFPQTAHVESIALFEP